MMARAEILGVAQAVAEELAFDERCDNPAQDLLELSAALALIAAALRDHAPIEQRAFLLRFSLLQSARPM